MDIDLIKYYILNYGYIFLGPVILAAMLMGASVIRWKKSKHAEVQSLPATLVKVSYETGYAQCRVFFLVDGEKKRRSFDARRGFAVRMPEIGTKGTLTCKGHILYSFEWDDQKIVQDDPAYGKTGYADVI